MASDDVAPTGSEEDAVTPRTRMVEAIFDNLPFWTVAAAAIAFLYLVWVTLDVLSRYVGWIPKVGP